MSALQAKMSKMSLRDGEFYEDFYEDGKIVKTTTGEDVVKHSPAICALLLFASTRKPTKGYVYFAQNSAGNIKIGFTTNLNKRMKALMTNTGSDKADTIQCLAHVEYEDQKYARAKETELHKRFKDARIKGEWFKPVPELMEYIGGSGL